MESLLHDLAKCRSQACQPVVPQACLFFLFVNGGYVSPFPVAGNFLRWPQLLNEWRVAQPLPLTVPLGLMDAFHQFPWTCAPSPSLDGLKPVFLQHVVPSFCQSLLLSPFITWFGALLGEDRVRNIIEYLSSPYPWKPGLLFLAGEGPHFPQPFSYHQCTYRSFSCCPGPLGFFFNESFHAAIKV